MNNTVLYLITHSEASVKGNIKRINTNQNNIINDEKLILSVSGEKNAEAMSKNKELQNIDAVYASNYVRALSTAKYIAQENNTIINVDDRLNKRRVGNLENYEWAEFMRFQAKNFDNKMPGGESMNQVKRRMTAAIKNILMFEAGNRVAIVSHRMAITCLLLAWCDIGYNYNGDIILSYNDQTIIDGSFEVPRAIKVTFDGMNVINIEAINL